MSRLEAVSAWEAEVSSHLPHLSRPQAAVLALWSLGIALAGEWGQTSVVAVVADLVGQRVGTVRQRLREWCYAAGDKAGSRRGVRRRELAVATCFAPLVGWVLAWWETPSADASADASPPPQSRRLALSVLYRRCAIPVAWVVVRAQEPGPWRPHWLALLADMQGSIPADWLVVVAADRGLYAPGLYQAIVACGWHPFLRLNAGPHDSGRYRRLSTARRGTVAPAQPPATACYRRWARRGQARSSALWASPSAGHSSPAGCLGMRRAGWC